MGASEISGHNLFLTIAHFRLQWFVYRLTGWDCIKSCLQEISHYHALFGHFTNT